MSFIKINEHVTFYEVYGEGDTVILLHNGFSCSKMWEKIVPILVAAGFRVLVYDRRGYGQSEGGMDFETHYNSSSFRGAAVASMAQLVDYLELETFHIVGQCEGGVVGVDYAVRYPDRVRTLTAASTLCFSQITMEAFNRLKFPPTYDDLSVDIQKKYVDWHGPDRAESFYALCSRYGGSYGRGLFDLRTELQSVACPTLVMYPDRGHFFEAEQGVSFFRNLSKGELAIFPKCGHNIFEHYPELYAQTAVAFMERFRPNIA
jgi:pimeloyl-ACP methyl ester carboxylesterase